MSPKQSGQLAAKLMAGMNRYWMADPGKSRTVLKAVKKRFGSHPNAKHKDSVREKWYRLFDARPRLYDLWQDIVRSGRSRELMTLEMRMLEKEMGPTDQKDVMKTVMAQYTADAPSCCDEILDGFEVVPGKNPFIKWRDGDRMIDMTCLRIHAFTITRDDDFRFDIMDMFDKNSEDHEILQAWRERAASWKLDSKIFELTKAYKSAEKCTDQQIIETVLRHFVGYVYIVQAYRVISFHQEVMLDLEIQAEEQQAAAKKKKAEGRKNRRIANRSNVENQNIEIAPAQQPANGEEDETDTSRSEGTPDHTDKDGQLAQKFAAGGNCLEQQWRSFERARRTILAERVVRRQRQLEQMCASGRSTSGGIASGSSGRIAGGKPARHSPAEEGVEGELLLGGEESKEKGTEAWDEWQSFEEVLGEVKAELAAYKR